MWFIRNASNQILDWIYRHAPSHKNSGADEILLHELGEPTSPVAFNAQNLTGTGTITASSSVWWRETHIGGGSFAPGASGATAVDPSANGPGGWGLDLEAEHVSYVAHIESDWDAASNLKIEVYFQYDDDNTGGGSGANDQITLDLNLYYMKVGDTAIKTQSFTDACVIGQSPQYKMFESEFDITYNPGGGNNIAVEDVMGMHLNLDVTNSSVGGGTAKIIANVMEFKYKTAKPNYEV